MGEITGLDSYGLKKSTLRKFGKSNALIFVYLTSADITPDVLGRAPAERMNYLAIRATRAVDKFRGRFPHIEFHLKSGCEWPAPYALQATVPGQLISKIAQVKGVRAVHLAKLSGHKRMRKRKEMDWFCVRGRVAIQVEGRTRGMQSVEDRFVVVRANSPEDAEKRLAAMWIDYAEPSLNSKGYAVRWKLEKIVDVYSMFDQEISANGTEVFSDLFGRRMKPQFQWQTRVSRRLTSRLSRRRPQGKNSLNSRRGSAAR